MKIIICTYALISSIYFVTIAHAEQKKNLALMIPPILASQGAPSVSPPVGIASATSYFPKESVWYSDISGATLDAQSGDVINWLTAEGGWGNDDIFQIDFSIKILNLNTTITKKDFEETGDSFNPDCDHLSVPVPANGSIEGNPGYECLDDGDCHLIVADWEKKLLYEMWRANIIGNTFYGGCMAVWDMTKNYPPSGRGDQCTSADAAGYPISPLLFNADEVASGEIKHALRFILPNARIRNGVYVHPATHSTNATSGGGNAPPYGTRLRLKATFDMNRLPNNAARVVARALQKYGMFLADGGSIPLTAESDQYTTAKWAGLLGSRDLNGIKVTDFEMIEAGSRIPYTGDCQR
jgi:serine/threonine-protein kinase